MRKQLLCALVLLLAAVCNAQQSQTDIVTRTRGNLPTSRISAQGVAGLCLQTDGNGGVTLATCAAGGGGSGTVTTFSAGTLAPLFTTSVATATITPALSFALSNAAAHTFFGNNTGSTAAPAFAAITAADLPGVFAQTIANTAHKWLNSYDAATGLFTQTQPAYSDLTGTPTLPATKTAVASNWLNSYDATTGLFTAARPAYTDLTGLPQFAVTKAAVASNWLRSYDSTTGLFTASQPAYTDITGTPTLAATLANAAHKWFNSYSSVTGLFTQTQPDYSDLTGTPQLAVTKAAVTSNWLRSYDSITGLFTASQPAYTDISGTPTLPATLANAAHKWLNSYTSSTGLFTQTQPDYSDLTGTPTLEYQTVQDEGTPLTQRAAVNFTGAGVTCADNAGASRTDCTISGGGGAGSGTVTNTAGALTSGQLLKGNGGSDITVGNLTGDCTTSGSTATTCTKTNGAAFAASATTDTTNATNITTGTLPAGQLPAFSGGDVTSSAGSANLAIGAGKVTRADLAADAVGWQFSCTATSTSSTISCTPSTARKHYIVRLIIAGYSGGGGIARAQLGNAGTPDTGTNYAFGGFNIVSGTSTAPTLTGVGSGSTAQSGCPVSGSATTIGRFVQMNISNPGAVIKYFTIETSGVGASAAVTPNLAHIACTWNNTTSGIGVIQFQACSAINGTCTTVNFLTGTTLTVWGRDDN